MSRYRGAALGISFVLAITPVPRVTLAQDLGQITFPNSGSAQAQAGFIRGVLLLHSFEYERAAAAFRDAQLIDPSFALAFWGEAMTFNHPIWNEQDRSAAQSVLRRFGPTAESRRLRIPTAREQAYFDAVEALFGPDGSKETRDTLYAEAMQSLVERFPSDLEAKAFYALALLGLSQGERNVATYMRAAAVAQEVFDANPRHPGAAHYIIHSFDDPVHAPLGLKAARAYATIAPDAPHAQHMTTHIFLAMGMWDEVVSQNTIAAGPHPWRPGHYTSWLGYGYLQQGRFTDALSQLEEVFDNVGANAPPGRRAYLADMRANYVIGTERWNSSVLNWELDFSGIDFWGTRGRDAFLAVFSALKRGEAVDSTNALSTLMRSMDVDDRSTRIQMMELRALFALREGRLDAVRHWMYEATALEENMPFEFGPPVVVKPSHELFGEILLEMGEPAEAQAEFELALRLAPNRTLSLIGLGRAAAAAGDHKTALRAYTTLRDVLHRAEPNFPPVGEAQRYIESHQVSEAR